MKSLKMRECKILATIVSNMCKRYEILFRIFSFIANYLVIAGIYWQFGNSLPPPSLQCGQTQQKHKRNGEKIKTVALKTLWGDCLELELYIRSNTAHGIYNIDGDIPEMTMLQEASKLSQLCDFEWFEWVMF